MIWRIVLTIGLFIVWSFVQHLLNGAETIAAGSLAADQLNGGDLAYLKMNTFGAYLKGNGMNLIILLALLALIWYRPIKRWIVGPPVALLLLVLLAPDARAYYDKQDWAEVMNIQPNQSAFIIPDVGDNKSSQAAFGSVEFLAANKVALKRVQIPHVKLENSGLWSNFYVPAARLVLVDRTPYYREWTSDPTRGTSKKDEGLRCESADSINVTTAVNVSAFVEEKNAATFLYWFGVNPPQGIPAIPPSSSRQSCTGSPWAK
jgi:hypothetical protein